MIKRNVIKIRKNKILYFSILSTIILFISGCNSQGQKNSYESTSIVDFDQDSVFYQLDIKAKHKGKIITHSRDYCKRFYFWRKRE